MHSSMHDMLKTKPLPHMSRSVLLRVTTLIIAMFAAASFGTDSKSRTNRFEEDILAFEAADQKNPLPKGAILFVGDSLFTLWKSIQTDLPEYTVINRGFGGSQMSDLLYYTDRIVIPYKPRLIIVNEGGNDIHRGRMPEQVLADVRAFVEKVRAALPDTRIAISSLTPSPARWSEAEIAKHANRIIRDYVATQRNVVFIDLFDAYLGPDGKPREELFVEDGLHHSAAAYRLRIRAMRGILGEPDKKRSNENRSGIADGREVALGDDLHLSTTHRDLFESFTAEFQQKLGSEARIRTECGGEAFGKDVLLFTDTLHDLHKFMLRSCSPAFGNKPRHAGLHHDVEPDPCPNRVPDLLHGVFRQSRDVKVLLDTAGRRRSS
jgi:lysophospholipase L1-like esterase